MRIDFRLRQTKTGTETFTKVFAPVNKASLRQEILSQLRQELDRQASAAETSRDEARQIIWSNFRRLLSESGLVKSL